jgi:hypothetical protein
MSVNTKERLTQKERIEYITKFIQFGETPEGFVIKKHNESYQIRRLKPKAEVSSLDKKIAYHQAALAKLLAKQQIVSEAVSTDSA